MDTINLTAGQHKKIKRFAMMMYVEQQIEQAVIACHAWNLFPVLIEPMEKLSIALQEEIEAKDDELFEIPTWTYDKNKNGRHE